MFFTELVTAVKAVARSRLARPVRSARLGGLVNGNGGPTNFLHQQFSALRNSLHTTPHSPVYQHSRTPVTQTIRHASSFIKPLARPGPPFLARAPRVQPQVFQMGLGSARNFSSGRPIFQNIIENVPITTRTLWEVEWKDKAQKKQRKRVRRAQAAPQATQKFQKIAPLRAISVNYDSTESVSDSESSDSDFSSSSIDSVPSGSIFSPSPLEMDQYFRMSTLVNHPVDTLLHIPLSSEPGGRQPLPSDDPFSDALAVREILRIRSGFSTHSNKVAALFSRLDLANVWDHPGVRTEFYRSGPDPDTGTSERSTLPSHITVIFGGWTQEMVRRVVGNTSRGWCTIEEVRRDTYLDAESDFDSHFDFVSTASAAMSVGRHSVTDGMNESLHTDFIMPSLDFSSSFVEQTSHASSEWSDGSLWA